MPSPPLPITDLDHVLEHTQHLWPELTGQRIFLTGGTGFFGAWLTESFLHIDRALGLGAGLTVLSRDPARFLARMPHLHGEPALRIVEGDVRNFAFARGEFPFVIHAATEARARQLAEAPGEMHSTIIAGTERSLAFAASAGTRKLLFTSSGAAYGPQRPPVDRMPEDHPCAPDNVYGEGKLAAEQLCGQAATSTLEIKIARAYAFLGPHLPLDAHFAAGNFLSDALSSRDIHVASDGSAVRSYLYASDLAVWLWTMLFRGESLRPYNLGSEDAVTVRGLAEAIRCTVNPALKVKIAESSDPTHVPHRYVPSTARARGELGLRQTVSLEEAIRRTAAWHRLK